MVHLSPTVAVWSLRWYPRSGNVVRVVCEDTACASSWKCSLWLPSVAGSCVALRLEIEICELERKVMRAYSS